MACQRLALCLLFLLAGNEVLAARQRVRQSAGMQEFDEFFANLQDNVNMNFGHGSTTDKDALARTSCNKDIIVKSSNKSKTAVFAHDYSKRDVEVLKKFTNDCTHTYSVICSGGNAAIRKDSTCAESVIRYFDFFHWQRNTEIKPSKGETSIKFSNAASLQDLTSGKVTFIPSGTSCSAVSSAMTTRALEIKSLLDHDQVRNFKKVSSILNDYVNKKNEMIAMGCPADLVDTNQDKIVKELRAYFDSHSGGKDSPMADARFSAAVDKIKSVQSPTKKDFAEVVALMRFGSCPEAKETQVSLDSLTGLVDEMDEPEEEKLVEDIQTCFVEDNCDAINGQYFFPETPSLIQQEDNSSSLMHNTGFWSAVKYFLVFFALFVVILLFWPIVLFILIIWLLVLLVMLPFKLLSGPTVTYELRNYHLGTYDYLVDEYCRPAINVFSGYPLRQVENQVKEAKPAPPVQRYVIYKGAPLVDSHTGWPIAALDNGVVKPLIGLPKPGV